MFEIPANGNTTEEVGNALGEVAQLVTKRNLTAQAIADELDASKAARRAPREPICQAKLIPFGNSITAPQSNFATIMAMKSNGQFIMVKNAGVNGDTTVDMLARISDIDGADVVTVMEGANDAENNITLDTHRANIDEIINYAIDDGSFPYMIASPTCGSGSRGYYIHQANLFDYVTLRKLGVPMYNPWDVIVSDDGNGNQIAAATLDGVHPNSYGHQLAGEELTRQIKNREFYIPLPIYNSYYMGEAILNNNALFINHTDNLPDNISTQNDPTLSLGKTELGLGNTFTANYVNGPVDFKSDYFPVSAGDTYLVVFRLGVNLTSGSPDIIVRADFQGGSQNIILRSKGTSVSDMTVTAEYTIPAGVTGLRFACYAVSGTYNVDVSIAQLQFYNLTHFGL